MKSLVESLRSSLSINEGREQVIVFFDHDNPERTIVYVGTNPKSVELIQNSAYDWINAQGAGSALYINHSDEWGSVIRYANVAKFKTDQLKSIKDDIKSAGPDPDYIFIETDFAGFDIEDDAPKVAKMSDSQLYKRFVEDYFNNSFIDGDSASAKALVDLSSKKVILCGEMDVHFYTDADISDMFGENETEDVVSDNYENKDPEEMSCAEIELYIQKHRPFLSKLASKYPQVALRYCDWYENKYGEKLTGLRRSIAQKLS